MPVIVELRNRVKRDQQNLLRYAKNLQNIIAKDEGNVGAIKRALGEAKEGISAMLTILNKSLNNDLKQANKKEQSNYTALTKEFRAKKQVYTVFLDDEIGQISLILNILKKSIDKITSDNITYLLNSASRLVTLCETMIDLLDSISVSY